MCVDTRATYDAIAAVIDACEPAGSNSKLHFISVRDRMIHGLIRKFFWADTRDMMADGVVKGGVDRSLLRNVGNGCNYQAIRVALEHRQTLVGSASTSSAKEEPSKKTG